MYAGTAIALRLNYIDAMADDGKNGVCDVCGGMKVTGIAEVFLGW